MPSNYATFAETLRKGSTLSLAGAENGKKVNMESTQPVENENVDLKMPKGIKNPVSDDGNNTSKKRLPPGEFGMTLEEAFKHTSKGR